MKRTLVLSTIFTTAALALSSDAFALDEAACCLQSTSRLDSLMNPISTAGTGESSPSSDEKFFSQPGGPANVMFIMDNSGSMNWWPFDGQRCHYGNCSTILPGDSDGACPGNNDCTCAAINTLGYDPTEEYEAEIKNYNSGTFYDEWFNRSKYYEIRDAWGYGLGLNSNPGGTIGSSRDDACQYANDNAKCKTCLDTKGYYLDTDSSKRRVTGNFLNFVGPRALMARRVVKQVIRDIRPVRMAVSLINETDGDQDPYLLEAFSPACNKADWTSVKSHFYSNRQSIAGKIESDYKPNGGTPLTKAMLAAGHLFTTKGSNILSNAMGSDWADYDNMDVDNLDDFTEAGTSNQFSVCFPCTFNAIILLTDGEPSNNREDDLPATVGPSNRLEWADCKGSRAACSYSNPCSNGEDCIAGKCSAKCDTTGLDEVADWLWRTDLRNETAMSGVQKAATYTVAFALDPDSWANKLLARTATSGGGLFMTAKNAPQLKAALLSIFDDINNRNTAFSSSAISSLQTGSSNLTALIPRMEPQASKPWIGQLYRFGLFNEFIEGVDHPQESPANGNKSDIYLTDNTASYTYTAADGVSVTTGKIVNEDPSTGAFVQKGSGTAAVPYWEAGAKLRARCGGQAWKETGCTGAGARKIWTVVANSATAHTFTDASTLLEFSTANWSTLADYLGIKGTTFCPSGLLVGQEGDMLTRFKMTVPAAATAVGVTLTTPTPTRAELEEVCVKALIRYVRGQDFRDDDGDADITDSRPSTLGDIFHSSPIIVDPPVERFLCELGLHTQCARTLFSKSLEGAKATELTSYTSGCPDGKTECDAYDAWQWKYRKRQKLVLVGANDGMLHAFNAGKWTGDANGYDQGDGEETWAFIPPDLLPRLQEMIKGHAFYMDGDLMVRDIWADSATNPNKKDQTEFHTMVVAAEGRGGIHYLGLEVAFDSADPPMAKDRPSFRWMFPQPCSDLSTTFGKTLLSLAPKPPPIGPVLLEKSTGHDHYPSPAPKTEERWVAMLSGGWSPSLERGRGVYMVDVWNGLANSARQDNLLWKWDRPRDGQVNASDPKVGSQAYLTQSVVAPVAMVDYGSNDAIELDGFFDTAVFGDTAGQVWVARMHKPGKVDGTTGLITNWSAARAFEQDRDNLDGDKKRITNVWPFFYLPSLGIQPETRALRAFIGTGNRYAMLEKHAGACRYDNPMVCAKYGCDEVKNVYRVDRLSYDDSKQKTKWKYGSGAPRFEEAKLNVAIDKTPTYCGENGTHVVRAKFEERSIEHCGDQNTNVIEEPKPEVKCGKDADGNFACSYTDPNATWNYGDMSTADSASQLPPDTFQYTNYLSALGNNRFYGFWAYGGNNSRVFVEDGSDTAKTPTTYDGNRLTDRKAGDADGDLVDVTCQTTTGVGASSTGWGWLYEYRNSTDTAGAFNATTCSTGSQELDRRTASGAALIGSCVMWNATRPIETAAMCAQATAKGRFYQADYLTGLPGCAAAFAGNRFQERDVLTPPPEPATVIQVSRTGQIRYSALLIEPGKEKGTEVSISTNNEPLQSIYELPLTRALHLCRHSDATKCVSTPP